MGVFGQVGGGWVSFLLGGEPTGDEPSWMLHCQAKLPRSPSYHINTFSSPKLFWVFWGKSGQWTFKNLWENVLNLECKTLPATCRCPLPLSIKIKEGQFKDSSSFNIGNLVVHMRHRILKWWWWDDLLSSLLQCEKLFNLPNSPNSTCKGGECRNKKQSTNIP